MSDFHSNYRRQLATAAGELFPAPDARPRRKPNRSQHVPLLTAIVFAVLLGAAAALAATGVIGFGAPVKASHPLAQEPPSVTAGVGIPVVGANGNPASVQPLAISVPDPGGGLPWGMRIVRTTRGLLCLQIGRLLDGRLGVIGQDGQFGDDGLFHELPASVLNPDTCITPSVWTMLSDAGLPAAGALPSPITPCLPPWLHPRVSTPPPCPASDERLIGFGMLGPHAVSVSYMVDGQLHTAATVGRLGAYLVVLRVPPKLAHNFPVLGGKSGLLDGFPIGAGKGEVVSRLEFRFDGHLCQTGFDREPDGPPQCKSQIAGRHVFVPNVPRGLHAPVALTARKVAGGFDLEVTFTAPAAVTNASVAYGVQVTRPSSPACGAGGIWGQSIERDVVRGESVHVTEFVPQPPGCNGVVKGEVMLGAQTGALRMLGSRDETIGRFTFNLPG
ncbi:MAG: hypothetical protein ABR992_08440 [Solirubrobacteraceae bacterium]